MQPETARKKCTVPSLKALKGKRKLATLTAYDATFAAALDAAEIDAILVGDSLGMVVQGRKSTSGVSVADIAYHLRAVAAGNRYALLIGDMPSLSYTSVTQTMKTARTLLMAGAEMVKLEGAGPMLECIEALAARDVPVCAHLGLTPQSVHKLGGFKVQGRDELAQQRLKRDAQAVADAGADMLVLECVPSVLADEITRSIAIPTIGIGAGPGCDGQILVLHDLLGIGLSRRPRFVKSFLEGAGSIPEALRAYVTSVRQGAFPGAEHSYEMQAS